MINKDYLENLNDAQKEAVLHLDGPLLIVAGAGSGKTKVLTSRIANIIKEKKAFPNQILAVTFTNKAAKEMQNRVSKILGSNAVGLSWLGTFHSICAKLLRKHASAANLNSNFTIVDTDDQIRLIKNICKAENIDIKQLSPRFILAIIDRWKNKGFYPDEVIINKKDLYEKTILPLYKIYQQKLTDLNSCDFGDLILHSVKILEKNEGFTFIEVSAPKSVTDLFKCIVIWSPKEVRIKRLLDRGMDEEDITNRINNQPNDEWWYSIGTLIENNKIEDLENKLNHEI